MSNVAVSFDCQQNRFPSGSPVFEFLGQQLKFILNAFPFARRSFEIYPDSFADNQQNLVQGVVQLAVERAKRGEWVIVGAQFADGFLALEKGLTASGAEFAVIPPKFSPEVLTGCRLMLGLTTSLQSLTEGEFEVAQSRPGNMPARLNVMVLQRHPLRKNDEAFAVNLKLVPLHVRVGFFLSLDDPLLGVGVPEGLLEILDQMGMSHHQLVSSRMLTRRVQATQRRIAKVVSEPKPADSVQEWMDLNLPEPRAKKNGR
jgi:hypothetical protein